MTKNSKDAPIGFSFVHRSIQSVVKRCFSLMSALLAVILLGVLVTSCGIYFGTGSPSSPPPATQSLSVGNTASCTGYDITGGGQQKTFPSVTVPNGCVMIIDTYSGSGFGSDCPRGCVVGVGSGTYTLTLTSGEYQITSAASGNQLYCTKITQLQQANQADSNNYPMPGWNC